MSIDTRPRTSQVEQQVFRYITANKLGHGDRLPSETDMARQLGVSRNTVREAYISMERDGVILRRHGVGTIVVRSTLVDSLHSARRSYPLMLRAAGYEPRISDLERSFVTAPPEAVDAFGLRESESLLCVSRVVLADGVPAVYIIDYFAPGIRDQDLEWNQFDGDMIDFIALSFGARDFRYHSTIEAENIGPEIALRLGIAEGTPIVVTRSTVYTLVDLRALVYTVNFLNPSVITLDVSGTLIGSSRRTAIPERFGERPSVSPSHRPDIESGGGGVSSARTVRREGGTANRTKGSPVAIDQTLRPSD